MADEAWPWAVPDVILKDLLLTPPRLTDSLARACLPRLKILSMSDVGHPMCLRTSLMWDLETVSKPASMSVWIIQVFVPLHLMFSKVLQRVRIASGMEKDLL